MTIKSDVMPVFADETLGKTLMDAQGINYYLLACG